MSKVTAVVLAAMLVLSSGIIYAEDSMKKDGMMDKGDKGAMMGGGMMGSGMMGKGMMGMHQMHEMMEKMHQTVVATPDGGIIIVGAAKITKYDKDLNVVKEVELKENADAMHEMMEKCSGMMGKGMMGDGMMGNGTGDDAAAGANAAAPSSEVDHASHH